MRGKKFEIQRRAFVVDDGSEPETRFQLRLDSGAIGRIADSNGAESAGLVRLDAAEIASIYPLHEEDRSLVALADVPELLITG